LTIAKTKTAMDVEHVSMESMHLNADALVDLRESNAKLVSSF